MSYDIRFGVKVAGAPDNCYAVIGHPEYDTPTYNLRSIFEKSMDWDYDQEKWYPIKEVLPKIQKGCEELKQHPEKYKKLEPPNGWGTVDGAYRCLHSIVEYFDPDSWEGIGGTANADIPTDCFYMCW